MKIIDLLVKMSENEEMPYKIKYRDKIYEYDGETSNYFRKINFTFDFLIGEDITALLNDEIEIIEEDKKIKMLEPISGSELVDLRDRDQIKCNKSLTYLITILNNMNKKINNLIYEVNNLKGEDK